MYRKLLNLTEENFTRLDFLFLIYIKIMILNGIIICKFIKEKRFSKVKKAVIQKVFKKKLKFWFFTNFNFLKNFFLTKISKFFYK